MSDAPTPPHPDEPLPTRRRRSRPSRTPEVADDPSDRASSVSAEAGATEDRPKHRGGWPKGKSRANEPRYQRTRSARTGIGWDKGAVQWEAFRGELIAFIAVNFGIAGLIFPVTGTYAVMHGEALADAWVRMAQIHPRVYRALVVMMRASIYEAAAQQTAGLILAFGVDIGRVAPESAPAQVMLADVLATPHVAEAVEMRRQARETRKARGKRPVTVDGEARDAAA